MNRNANTHDDALRPLLQAAVDQDASDLHVVAGYPPTLRVQGRLVPLESRGVLTTEQAAELALAAVSPELRGKLNGTHNFDCSLGFETADGRHVRFRANLFRAQGALGACLRHIPDEIPALDWLGFPDGLARQVVGYRSGLVVVTGMTGSGKSTTLAALLQLAREDGLKRIVTIEEPIEYQHAPRPGLGVVSQREVGRDVASFADGLKYGLRQDPDIILVGEVRDRDTAQMALSAAETGHLILTTLHTRDAKSAVTRLVDLFPQDSQEDMRKQIALSLRSVVCQHLLPAANGHDRRVLALEVLHINKPAEVAIRLGKIESLDSTIQVGKREGMLYLDDELERLLGQRKISAETARRFAHHPENFPGTGAGGW